MPAYLLVSFIFSPALKQSFRYSTHNVSTYIMTVLHSKEAQNLIFYKGTIIEGTVFPSPDFRLVPACRTYLKNLPFSILKFNLYARMYELERLLFLFLQFVNRN